MPPTPLARVVQTLRHAASLRQGEERADGDLLDCFIHLQDASAFAELVRRHGPMVLSVCRRVLRDFHAAEDAFQATFAVLIRRAASVQPRSRVGNWLYGVAYRTALEARRAAARRRKRESLAAPPSPPRADWNDLRTVLDQELNRLPDPFRAVVVLCDLEGLTQKEAAHRLGWPEGTVASRLVRGRHRLARSLSRQGAVLAGGLTALAVAVVPAELSAAVVEAASRCSSGPGSVSPAVEALTREVLKGMAMSKVRFVMATVLSVALLVGAARWLWLGQPSAAARDDQPVQVAGRPADKPADAKDAGPSVKTLPPVVVKSLPESGDTQVDAAKTKEIRVTFSKPMTDKSWSWSQISPETFPKTDGDISYDKDGKTCILPVKLEPGKTYVIWVNSAKFGNFKDAEGNSAVPYLLVFQTK